MIKYFARNVQGRDFVVGDIHGAFDLVLRAMEQAKFDPAIDRLFSVGDLIDRGNGSHRCVKLLAQPYVHVVRGNHEDMLIDLYKDGEPAHEILMFAARSNGFGWWLSTSDSQRQDILAAICPTFSKWKPLEARWVFCMRMFRVACRGKVFLMPLKLASRLFWRLACGGAAVSSWEIPAA